MPKAFAAIRPISLPSMEPPPLELRIVTIPRITAKSTIPNTSSKTAAASVVTPSGESIFFWSDKMRAVIPTEVAVERIPKNKHRGSMKDALMRNTPTRSPNTKEKTTPKIPMMPPATEYFKNKPRSVSRPDAKSSIIEATVENA